MNSAAVVRSTITQLYPASSARPIAITARMPDA
jgi:hypothetical protein